MCGQCRQLADNNIKKQRKLFVSKVGVSPLFFCVCERVGSQICSQVGTFFMTIKFLFSQTRFIYLSGLFASTNPVFEQCVCSKAHKVATIDSTRRKTVFDCSSSSGHCFILCIAIRVLCTKRTSRILLYRLGSEYRTLLLVDVVIRYLYTLTTYTIYTEEFSKHRIHLFKSQPCIIDLNTAMPICLARYNKHTNVQSAL